MTTVDPRPDTATGRAITVMLVDDHAVVRRGLRAYLHEVTGMQVVQEAEIVTAVRTVAATAGGVCLDPLVARRLTQRLVRPTSGLSALTPRERDILALVATGRSNRQIADSLRISERTARTHVSNVLAKMRLASRTQAALVAIREGLVTVPDAAESGAAPRSVSL